MDQNYDWNNLTFKNRAGESLNLAVNQITDVLHTLYVEAQDDTQATDTIPEFPVIILLALFVAVTLVAFLTGRKLKTR